MQSETDTQATGATLVKKHFNPFESYPHPAAEAVYVLQAAATRQLVPSPLTLHVFLIALHSALV